jgi:hypothetical protein
MALRIKAHFGQSASDNDVNNDMDFLVKVQERYALGGLFRKYRENGRTVRTIDAMFDAFSKKSTNAINRQLKEKADEQAKATGQKVTYVRFTQRDAIEAMAGLADSKYAPLERDWETFISQLKREMGYEHFVPTACKRAVIEWLLTELVSAPENEGSKFLQFTDIAIDDEAEPSSESTSTPLLDTVIESASLNANA